MSHVIIQAIIILDEYTATKRTKRGINIKKVRQIDGKKVVKREKETFASGSTETNKETVDKTVSPHGPFSSCSGA